MFILVFIVDDGVYMFDVLMSSHLNSKEVTGDRYECNFQL